MYLSDKISKYLNRISHCSSHVRSSQTKLRKLGIFPNEPSKLYFARYKPLALEVWADLLKDPNQGSGLPGPKICPGRLLML